MWVAEYCETYGDDDSISEFDDDDGPGWRVTMCEYVSMPLKFPARIDCERAADELNRMFPIKRMSESFSEATGVPNAYPKIREVCLNSIRW